MAGQSLCREGKTADSSLAPPPPFSSLLLPPLTLLAAMAADAVPREIPKKVSISLAVLVDL